ncbi:MAG: glycosyltransferase family 39 protein [Bacteroidota bacterium]
MEKSFDKNYLNIACIAILFYLPFIGSTHLFDWDEINFAESAREMLVTGNYSRVQIDYKPFWEKPPLFFWMQAISMKIFGVTEFAARFPNVICGVVSLLTIYTIGKKLKNSKFGIFWALCFGSSILPFLYFKSGIIDPWYNYFIFVSGYFILETIKSSSNKQALLGGLFLGLAIITKGPVAVIILLITALVYLFYTKSFKTIKWQNVVLFVLSSFAVSSIWFGYETIKHGTSFLTEFIDYQVRLFSTPDSGHGQPFFYHFLVVFFLCFPISIFALPKLVKKANKDKKSKNDSFLLWSKILFWTVLILFSLVKTKIIHYSSLCYLPLSYIAANYLYFLSEHKKFPRFSLRLTFLIVGSIVSVAFAFMPFVSANTKYIVPYMNDEFAIASLRYPASWNGYEFLIGIFLLVIVIIVFFKLKSGIKQQVYLLFFSTATFMFLFLAVVVPKIERFLQSPAINFYEALSGKNVIVSPVGFKSYAHYYYFKKPQHENKIDGIDDNLIDGKISKDVYLVTKITHHELDNKKHIFYLGRQGGFDFWYRPAKQK